MEHNENYMKISVELAKEALRNGNPPVGAIIVHNNKVLGKGIESGKSTGDITNHAEILAIRDTINNGHKQNLSNATMYTTHEPCVMCSYVIRHHQIPMIVYGSPVQFMGGDTGEFDVLTTTKIPKWERMPEIIGGVLLKECKTLTELYKINNEGQNKTNSTGKIL